VQIIGAECGTHQILNLQMKLEIRLSELVKQIHTARAAWLCSTTRIGEAYLTNSHESTHNKEKWQAELCGDRSKSCRYGPPNDAKAKNSLAPNFVCPYPSSYLQ
jgi:hypothetical protein